jgi:predicted nucleic acid-binding protein
VIVGLDTSVLVRLLTGEPRELALVALDYLQEREKAGDRVIVSDWVLAEAYYALQHHYGASKRDTLNALGDFLASP